MSASCIRHHVHHAWRLWASFWLEDSEPVSDSAFEAIYTSGPYGYYYEKTRRMCAYSWLVQQMHVSAPPLREEHDKFSLMALKPATTQIQSYLLDMIPQGVRHVNWASSAAFYCAALCCVHWYVSVRICFFCCQTTKYVQDVSNVSKDNNKFRSILTITFNNLEAQNDIGIMHGYLSSAHSHSVTDPHCRVDLRHEISNVSSISFGARMSMPDTIHKLPCPMPTAAWPHLAELSCKTCCVCETLGLFVRLEILAVPARFALASKDPS